MPITLQKFLQKYTDVPLKFIKEYCYFRDLTSKDPFGIDLNEVVQFLSIQNVKRYYERFRDQYEEKYDYIVKIPEKRGTKQARRVFYYIDFKTFSNLCLVSNTEKGQECRDYFITINNFVDYYKEFIAKSIDENIVDGYDVIYILAVDEKSELLKIGRTKDLRQRLRTYMTGREKHPDIQFVMAVKNVKGVEKCAKEALKKFKYRRSSELYKTTFDVARRILKYCGEFSKVISELPGDLPSFVMFDKTEFAMNKLVDELKD